MCTRHLDESVRQSVISPMLHLTKKHHLAKKSWLDQKTAIG